MKSHSEAVLTIGIVTAGLLLLQSQLVALQDCKSLKEDLPEGLYKYAVSMRDEFQVLGMALDELLPMSIRSLEAEDVMVKARELLLDSNWQKLSFRHYFETRLQEKRQQDADNGQGAAVAAAADMKPVRAIEMFHSMRDCLYKCNYASSFALAANFLIAFEGELYPADDDRVKWTILRVVELHRRKCFPSYLEQFSQLHSTLEFDSLRKLNKIFDTKLLGNILKDADIRTLSSIELNDRLLQRRGELFDQAVALAGGTEDAKYVSAKRSGFGRYDYEVHPWFRTRTVARHILEPCRVFVRQFRDIFYPMRVDLILRNSSSIILSSTEQSQQEMEDELDALEHNDPTRDKEFVDLWTKYRLCRELSVDRSHFADLIAGETAFKIGLIEPGTTIPPT